MTLDFACRHCGVRFPDLSEHYSQCAAKRAADDLRWLAAAKKQAAFDRAVYHKAYMKAYMREYMRGWRARRKGL